MKRILIVEDNSDWRELLAMILRRLGYDVLVAVAGEGAVQAARLKHPDLILMDLGLPKMSGDEATQRIKSDSTTKDIPIIIQTAFGSGANATRAMEAGALQLLQKPISITEIDAVLKKYLSAEAKVPIAHNPLTKDQTIRTAP